MKKLFIITIILFSLCYQIHPDTAQKDKYLQAIDFSEAGAHCFYWGIALETCGIGLISASTFLDFYYLLEIPGQICLWSGYVMRTILSPVFSIISDNDLKSLGVRSQNLEYNSAFWYGISWIGNAIYTAGIFLRIAGAFSERNLAIAGFVLTIVGYLLSIPFGGASATLPLFYIKL